MIEITESAKTKITELLREENDPNLKLRTFVQGGGCSGFQYGFSIEEEQQDDDYLIPAGSTEVLVDSLSYPYLENATVDFKDDLQGSRFSISNPMAQTTCGCGSSFAPY